MQMRLIVWSREQLAIAVLWGHAMIFAAHALIGNFWVDDEEEE
ncbi:MAG: hypothetical protein PHQ27_08200 [Victivallales bacterium]|nr:hypothetical protein [Victivallales bacterium]